MRLRVDQWWRAAMKRAVLLGAVPNPLEDDEHEWDAGYLEFLRADGGQAEPGDVWRVSWVHGGEGVSDARGNPVPESRAGSGYVLTCPRETCRAGATLCP